VTRQQRIAEIRENPENTLCLGYDPCDCNVHFLLTLADRAEALAAAVEKRMKTYGTMSYSKACDDEEAALAAFNQGP